MNYQHSFRDYMEVAEEMVTRTTNLVGWKAYAADASIKGGVMVTGKVPFGVYSRGERKGQPRFDHPKAHGFERVVVSMEKMNDRAAKYEAESGNCYHCHGNGTELHYWSAADGAKYRDCRRCNGSGKAPEAPDETK